MPDSLAIQPLDAFRATVAIPGSKSLTNRALLLAALAEGESTLTNVLFADDTRRMLEALTALGFDLDIDEATTTVRIAGRGGAIPVEWAELNLGNAGTAYRFLTAACCLGEGDNRGFRGFRLDGVARMRQRPVGELVEALRQLGAKIEYAGTSDFPPLTVHASGLRGGEVTMPPTLSSQYISALLQVGPYCRDGLTLRFDGPVTSRPYVEMTLGLMKQFGVAAQVDPAFTRIDIAPGKYRGTDYAVEADASNASYFLAAAAITPGSKCTVEGLGFRSLQGDTFFAERVLQPMGASVIYEPDAITVMSPPEGESLRAIDIDLNAMPDMAQTLAVAALFVKPGGPSDPTGDATGGTTIIRNVGNLRVKETDRLAALHTELTKLGAAVEIDGDDLVITPPTDGHIQPAAIDTYDDHRMAMSFALAGLRAEGVVINDPACVNKTFPNFFEMLDSLRG